MEYDGIILIVDDSPGEREILEDLLAEQKYKLAFASSGAEGIALATELIPDIILLDVMMPDMDGFEVCRHLRADPILGEVPIFMITVLNDRDSRIQGIEAGADNFITKPFDHAELTAHMRTITRLNRYRQLLLMNEQLADKLAQVSALYDISMALNSTANTDALLEVIVQKAKDLLNAHTVWVILWDQEKECLYVDVGVSEESEIADRIKQSKFPVNSGIASWVFNEGKSAIMLDVSEDESLCRRLDEDTELIVSSILCVPLRGREGKLGVLEAVNKKDDEFTEDDKRLLESIASNIAISIERGALYRELQTTEALLRRQNAELRRSVKQKYRFENIIGTSAELMTMLGKAEQVALTDSTVLVYGETGTGKELLAQAIHYGSPRSSKNFVTINCGAIPDSLLESELFGHERGAFTGANEQRIGRFEEANGGTLFLDEIGDMHLNLQVRLLRVLQEGIIQRLGSNVDIPVDVRIIAATHGDLAQLVAEARFRQDLYYRLKVFDLEIPPLRDRKEDIPLLIRHFIAYYNGTLGRQIVDINNVALDALRCYDYPGNIRELQHIVERAMILCNENTITMDELPDEIHTFMMSDNSIASDEAPMSIPKNNRELKIAKAEAQRNIERRFLVELLSNTNGNISEAARMADMNRSWLMELIGKHQLDLNQP